MIVQHISLLGRTVWWASFHLFWVSEINTVSKLYIIPTHTPSTNYYFRSAESFKIYFNLPKPRCFNLQLVIIIDYKLLADKSKMWFKLVYRVRHEVRRSVGNKRTARLKTNNKKTKSKCVVYKGKFVFWIGLCRVSVWWDLKSGADSSADVTVL